MREIFNEGRVVGLSAYESYVRQVLTDDKEATPMTEREWLNNRLTTNLSMILKVSAGETAGYHDYYLPEHSQLTSCSVVYGSLFQGTVVLSEDGYWGSKVEDYGPLISNTSVLHPVTPGGSSDVPTKPDPTVDHEEFVEEAKNFLNVTSAIVVQPGTWEKASDTAKPAYSFVPDLSSRPFVRILLSQDLTHDIYILLHGFSDKNLLKGSMSALIETVSTRPQDGDFLGPAIFPWACPVILIITSDIYLVTKEKKDKKVDNRLNVLRERVNYLATLHTAKWDTNLLTEELDPIQTESGDDILTDTEGTVKEMWDEQGDHWDDEVTKE